MKNYFVCVVLIILALIATNTPLYAVEDKVDDLTQSVTKIPFAKETLEFQVMSGAFFGLNIPSTPAIDYAIVSLRFGCMLNSPQGNSVLRGNFETLLELFSSQIFVGPGSRIIGGALMLRYNFVQPNAKWIPYIQFGGGGLYNNVYKNQDQRLIGQAFEFELQAALGQRYMFNDRWAISVEGSYLHISNAGLAERNRSLNSLGGLLGVSYCF